MKNFLFIVASILLDVIGTFDRCSSRHYDDVNLDVSTNTVELDAQGADTSFVDVSSNSHWRVFNSDDWVDVEPTEGKDNGQIRITAMPNMSNDKRYSSVRISCELMSIEVVVAQNGKEE